MIRYLLLISFIIHQYYLLGDALILTLNSAVPNYVNGCENLVKQELYQNRMQTAQLVSSVAYRSSTHIDVSGTIEIIIADTTIEPLAKVTLIEQLFKNKRLSQKLLKDDEQRLKTLREANQEINNREDFYMAIEKGSSRITGKFSEIIKALVASTTSSGKDILKAFLYFQEKDGSILARGPVPTDFLNMEQQQRVLTSEGKLRVGLYKVFLFEQIRDNIKSGALPIDSSYDYRSFEEYEIPGSVWNKEKDKLIQQAGLTVYRDSRITLLRLNEELNTQIKKTNEHIDTGQNKKVYFDADGNWHLMKDKSEEDAVESESLFSQEYVIPLLEVLQTVQMRAILFLYSNMPALTIHRNGPKKSCFLQQSLATDVILASVSSLLCPKESVQVHWKQQLYIIFLRTCWFRPMTKSSLLVMHYRSLNISKKTPALSIHPVTDRNLMSRLHP